MKRLNKIIFALAIVLGLGACELLENQQPHQDLPLDVLFNSTANLESALVGAYNDLQDGDAMGSSLPLFGEIMGDNASWSGSFEQWNDIARHDMDVTNTQIEAVWNDVYDGMNNINLILDAIESGSIDDAAFATEGDRIKGEALVLRAVLNFYAVRFWAKPWGSTPDNSQLGIPLLTEGIVSPESFITPSRSTVTEVYNLVISDLTEAISLLSAYPVGTAGRANAMNARALLAQVYLQQGNFAEVASLTGTIINSNTYALESTPQGYFHTQNEETSSEAVFDIVQTVQDNPGVNNSLSTFYASSDFGGRGDIQATQGYIDALNAVSAAQAANLPAGFTYEDLRSTALLYPETNGSISSLKYEDGTTTADNAPIIRFAGVILMRAEALAETATAYPSAESTEAIDLLNQIHLRSIRVTNASGGEEEASQFFSFSVADFASNEELIEAIRLERRVELAFEGQRKHDLV
ncbi:MAG TPA: RagB/SusD family nutrient uptake outer membrane protein, partial [Balneolaceae bacterium]|nr:RagB/SusD family nutrient uptake outer membrane protein [Balneolaceae bacterium]